MSMEIILASRSPRRQELFKRVVPEFTVLLSEFDEEPVMKAGLTPEETVLALSEGKAKAVQHTHPTAWIVGGDTVVVSPQGEILGIPKDREDARRMIKILSGKTHRVVTGICILGTQSARFTTTTDVTFYPLTDEEIDAYLQTEEPYDKAGAYGIQGLASLFVEKISGDYYNAVGFPVARVARSLQALWKEKSKNDKN